MSVFLQRLFSKQHTTASTTFVLAAGAATAFTTYHYSTSSTSTSAAKASTMSSTATTTTTTTMTKLNSQTPPRNLKTAYTATFSVPLSCTSCIDTLTTALSPVPGIQDTSFSLADNLVTVTATAPPSAILHAIQSTGRTAILRGTGAREGGAAVCILETPVTASANDRGCSNGGQEDNEQPTSSSVRGLVRLIELADDVTMVDVSVSGLRAGFWAVSVRRSGDVSRGVQSVGGVWERTPPAGSEPDHGSDGKVGVLNVGSDGRGALVEEVPWRVWEVLGRGMVVEPTDDDGGGEAAAVVGVVARSAGAWENDKVVCACSGKTVWQERTEMVGKGML